MKYPIKLISVPKDYIWGGTNLQKKWNKQTADERIAESWELSAQKGSESKAANGEYRSMTLSEIAQKEEGIMGSNCKKYDYFPLLIKLIDSAAKLSIQVHPADAYALKNEGQYGKTEMWYVAEAEKGAGVYCGFRKPVTREELALLLTSGKICEALNFIKVKAGDVLFIRSGTVHAICEGLTICEIQQNSNLTYRLYDYGRKDASGNERELHVEKALDVTDVNAIAAANETVRMISESEKELCNCEYFKVKEFCGDFISQADEKSFVALNFIDGKGVIRAQAGEYPFSKGDCYFLPAGMGEFSVVGEANVKCLLTQVN